ncbi:MAG: fibrobacter succinogenes major paralogous domain-containing protein, partial [Bacteroidales bacterium]|nr:fibrobacter succinogenes major paralogous domain-containing protein [Bacteroidales bacterium]
SPNTGTNESGFTALPGGYRWYDGVFNSFTEMAMFWGQGSGGGVLHFAFTNAANSVMSEGANSTEGNSVRCIKD